MADRFSYVKRGYDPDEVEKYIDTLETVIKSYKDKDAAIKNAIVSAQIAADNIIGDAEREARRVREKATRQLDTVANSIADQKRIVKDFQSDYNKMVGRYVQQFNDSDILQLYSTINELEEQLAQLRNGVTQTASEEEE